LEFILELIAEFLFEFLLQFVLELLFQFGLQIFAEPLRKKPHPLVAAAAYVLAGAALGALSLWLFPALMVKVRIYQWVNLVLTPVLVGIAMVLVGIWRRNHERLELRINRFSYGFLFAFSVAFVRFMGAASAV